jgi:hypothetical protein
LISDAGGKSVTNFDEIVLLSNSYPGTLAGFVFPTFFTVKDVTPEGIGPTLNGSIFIHRASTVFPEYAVLIGLFGERYLMTKPKGYSSTVPVDKLVFRQLQSIRQLFDILPGQKYVPTVMSTTPGTLSTGEIQTFCVKYVVTHVTNDTTGEKKKSSIESTR